MSFIGSVESQVCSQVHLQVWASVDSGVDKYVCIHVQTQIFDSIYARLHLQHHSRVPSVLTPVDLCLIAECGERFSPRHYRS